jgi:hypothetical protein
LIFYYESLSESNAAFIEKALKFILFFKYDRMLFANKVFPEPTGPANKKPLHGTMPSFIKYYFL